MSMLPNCPRCQIVRGAKLSTFTHGAKLSWCQIVRGAKLSAVPNCPWCQIVHFYTMVPNCPPTWAVPNCPWCQIVLVPNCPGTGWRTIWHRSQFDTGVNLAPRVLGGQFGTKSVKESIWHRYQFGTKSVKESIWHRSQFGTGPIWHQECKRGQFGTGTNLAPGPIRHNKKGKI